MSRRMCLLAAVLVVVLMGVLVAVEDNVNLLILWFMPFSPEEHETVDHVEARRPSSSAVGLPSPTVPKSVATVDSDFLFVDLVFKVVPSLNVVVSFLDCWPLCLLWSRLTEVWL